MTTTPTQATTDRGRLPAPPVRRWWLLALLSLAQFMLVLDVTVVNVAMPDIGADLALSRAVLPWVLTAYTLTFGGLMLLGGRAADLFGARRMLLIGLTVFVVGSLAAGLAPGAATLLTGRAAQGLGAALMSPAALAVLTTTFTGRDRSRALGVWAAIAGGGAALGVILGGLLTSGPGWRWIFFINVPTGLLLLLILPTLIPTTHRDRATRTPIDVTGAATVTLATGAVLYGLINAGTHGWAAASTLVPLALAVPLYAVFVAVERRNPAPLMPPRVLARRPVIAGSLLMLVGTGLLVGAFFLGSFYLQRQHGYTAAGTGLAFLPIALGTILGAHGGGHLVTKIDTRVLAAGSLAVAALGSALAAGAGGPVGLVLGLSVAAIGIGATFVTAFTTALTAVDPHEAGLRSGIVNTFHELGGGLGVAILSSVTAAGLTGAASTTGFSNAFTVSAVAAAAAAVLAAFVVPSGTATAGTTPRAH
ncbi:MAG TPA: MFS transporter [Actinoplanes sp.]|nr:MFS transporter [Actinoplanes sp.]